MDNTTYITMLYVQFFKRLPSASELTFYLNAMAAGQTQEQIFSYFVASPENQANTTALAGGPTDVANRQTVRNANYTGGIPGNVNSTIRNVDNVSAGATAFEWTETNILNSAANAGENVAGYNQANGTGTGEVWGTVSEVNQTQDAPAVGIEVDVRKAAGTADGIGIDIVNYGNETAEIQGGDGEIIWRDRTYNGKANPLTCIRSTPGGGIAIVVRGVTVLSYP